LRFLSLYLHLHDRGSVPYVWTDRHLGMFGYTLNCPEITGSDHIYDGAMAIACNMIRELVGRDWQPTEVRLFRDRPAQVGPFCDHFRAPPRLAAHQAAIVFPAAELQHPCISADAGLYARAVAELEAMDRALGVGLSDKVRRVLLRMPVTLVNIGDPVPDWVAIAELFALYPRTLNRRLRAPPSPSCWRRRATTSRDNCCATPTSRCRTSPASWAMRGRGPSTKSSAGGRAPRPGVGVSAREAAVHRWHPS
jgi:hypothetical protein